MNENDYISLTDITKYQSDDPLLRHRYSNLKNYIDAEEKVRCFIRGGTKASVVSNCLPCLRVRRCKSLPSLYDRHPVSGWILDVPRLPSLYSYWGGNGADKG